MPDRAISFAHEQIGPAYWANALQDMLGTYVSPNFRLQLSPTAPTTTLRVAAGSGADTVSLSIGGRYRYATANVERVHPGGAAGNYDVFAVAANDSISGSPVPFSDATNYAFELRILATGSTPTIVAGTLDVFRKIGGVAWDGTKIIAVRRLVGAGPLERAEVIGTNEPVINSTAYATISTVDILAPFAGAIYDVRYFTGMLVTAANVPQLSLQLDGVEQMPAQLPQAGSVAAGGPGDHDEMMAFHCSVYVATAGVHTIRVQAKLASAVTFCIARKERRLTALCFGG